MLAELWSASSWSNRWPLRARQASSCLSALPCRFSLDVKAALSFVPSPGGPEALPSGGSVPLRPGQARPATLSPADSALTSSEVLGPANSWVLNSQNILPTRGGIYLLQGLPPGGGASNLSPSGGSWGPPRRLHLREPVRAAAIRPSVGLVSPSPPKRHVRGEWPRGADHQAGRSARALWHYRVQAVPALLLTQGVDFYFYLGRLQPSLPPAFFFFFPTAGVWLNMPGRGAGIGRSKGAARAHTHTHTLVLTPPVGSRA